MQIIAQVGRLSLSGLEIRLSESGLVKVVNIKIVTTALLCSYISQAREVHHGLFYNPDLSPVCSSQHQSSCKISASLGSLQHSDISSPLGYNKYILHIHYSVKEDDNNWRPLTRCLRISHAPSDSQRISPSRSFCSNNCNNIACNTLK